MLQLERAAVENPKSRQTTFEECLQLELQLDPRIRCNFIARQLIYWARNLSFGTASHEVQFYPKFWLHYSHQRVFLVQREVLRQIGVLLLRQATPGNLHMFHLTGVALILEQIPDTEQILVLKILRREYGHFQ